MSTNQQKDGKHKACSHEPEVTVTAFHGPPFVLPYITYIHVIMPVLDRKRLSATAVESHDIVVNLRLKLEVYLFIHLFIHLAHQVLLQ